ncbi:hypothetical protein [Agromyces silvae]|uniref:hypothetical protein n=1 Tax=Agromyces silvae TaxID=3388266 RepID=UPI00280A9F89|nr:hypothetical protein [Agromyces protaetiae]
MKRLAATLTVAALAAGLTIGAEALAAPAMAEEPAGPPPAGELSVATPAEASAVAPPAEESDITPQAEAAFPGTIFADFEVSRVTLADGGAWGPHVGEMSAVPTGVDSATRGVFHVSGDRSAGATGMEAKTAFQVVMLGTSSGFWIAPRVGAFGDTAYATCQVYQGDPRSGGTLAASSPFTCDMRATQSWPNARYTFSVALNRYVETAAVFTTTGPVALTAGHFEFGKLPYGVPGTADVAQHSSTRAESVIREGDVSAYPDSARVEFTYRIVDDASQTTFWIAGWSNNNRAHGGFHRDGTCFIVDRDPRGENAPSLDQIPRAKVSPYTCELSEAWPGGSGGYEATFTVAKRDMIVLDGSGTGADTLLARELVDGVCGVNPDDCGLSLSKVTRGHGTERQMSETVFNGGDVEITPTKTISSSETITNSGGFKLTIKSIFNAFGAKWETALEVNYQRAVAETTSTTLTLPIKTPPHQKSWWAGSPPMVHTEGTVIVLKDGRYYEVVDVTAEFPDKASDAQWVIEQHWEPYLGAPPAVDPTSPGGPAADVSTSTPSSTGTARSLATTGVSEIQLVGWIAMSAVLLAGGAALVLIRRRRSGAAG